MNMAPPQKFEDLVALDDTVVVDAVPAIPLHWYLVRVHPMKERKTTDLLLRRGVSCYTPTFQHQVKVHRHWQQWTLPKTRQVRSPIFPGIIFVPDFDADIPRLKFFCADVVGLLRLGEFAARMNTTTFRSVQMLERTMGLPLSQAKRVFKAGDPIRVKWDAANPFAMWSGRFERLDGKGRLRVLLAGLSREIPVTLSEDQIEPV